MDRRAFLATFCIGIAGTVGGKRKSQVRAVLQEEKALSRLLSRPSCARRIGERILDSEEQEGQRMIRDGLAFVRGGPTGESREDTLRRVGKQIRRDYDSGRMIAVDGWVLSETEAHLCAAFASTP